MNISEVCIRRPVLTTLMMASIIVLGMFGYRLLPVAALPAVDFPTIRITATLPGASPETMAASVASPIERQLSTIAGITSLTSSSSLGNTEITVQFDLGRNIDGASLDVQTALAIAQRRLPIEMTTPPSFRKVNPGDFPVLFISMRSATMPLSGVNDFGETVMAPQLSQLPGVAQVAVYGAQKYAVRVQVDPVAAAARNISLDEIRTVISRANSAAPVGNLDGNKQSVTLVATSSLKRAADYADVVVKYVNGAPIEELRVNVSVPVTTSSQGLIEEVFAATAKGASRRIGVVSTVAQSIADLERDMARYAAPKGLAYTVEKYVAEEARPLFESGERPRHDRIVVAATERFRDIDVLILPQFSLTTAHAALPKVTGRTDLCASRSAIGLLKRLSA